MRKEDNIDENLYGCISIGTCMMALVLACLVLAFCSCKPQQKMIEVEKWSHDTTTVVDTVHIKDIVTLHDSIFVTEYVTQVVRDSTQKEEAYKLYTYDREGNVTSMMDYTAKTNHGSVAHTDTQSAATSVSEQSAMHEEKGGHSESVGHSDTLKSKEQIKTGLSKWQRFLVGMGYAFLTLIGLAALFGGMRLYGKYKKL